jgi:hypothetical protein
MLENEPAGQYARLAWNHQNSSKTGGKDDKKNSMQCGDIWIEHKNRMKLRRVASLAIPIKSKKGGGMKKGMTTLLVFVFMMSDFAFSQNPWSDHENRTTVALEWISPQFGNGYTGRIRTNLLTSVGYLNARIRLNDNIFILAEVPVSHYEWRLNDSGNRVFNKNSMRGNPYLGTELRSGDEAETWAVFLNAGTYLPSRAKTWYVDELLECSCMQGHYSSKSVPVVQQNLKPGAHPALMSDLDRAEAFRTDVWSIRLNAGMTTLLTDNKTRLAFSTGMIHNIFRGESERLLDPELYLVHSAGLFHRLEKFTVHTIWYMKNPVGISGLDFVDDALLQFRAGVAREFSLVTLGGFLHMPLSSQYHNRVKFSIGLSLGVNL